MNELQPCLDRKDPLNCTASLREEIVDVLTFQQLLSKLQKRPRDSAMVNTSLSPSIAFTVLTVLHNLVTDSVSKQFEIPGRRNFYCAKEVMKEIIANSEHLAIHRELEITDFGIYNLPGLSQSHRLVSCDGKVEEA